jgi:hypothetical protein
MAKLKKVWANKFTQVSNEVFDDPRLSYKDIGVYCTMMKFQDDWDFTIADLSRRHKEKKAAVTASINVLISYGYITRSTVQTRKTGGKFAVYEYTIYESPIDNPGFIPWLIEKKKMPDYTDEDEEYAITEPFSPRADYRTSANRISDERISGDRTSDERKSDNPPTNNTISSNTLSNNTNYEEEDISTDNKPTVNEDYITRLLRPSYMSEHFAIEDFNQREKLDRALDTMLKIMKDIHDPSLVRKINVANRDELGDLLMKIYHRVYCRKPGTDQEAVHNKTNYITSMIQNWFSDEEGHEAFGKMMGMDS